MLQNTGIRWIFFAGMGAASLFFQQVNASPLGEAIRQLAVTESSHRSVSLQNLGIKEPIVLSGTTSHDFYFPTPHGISLIDSSIDFDAAFLKGVPGSATVVLSANGIPAVAQSIPGGEGAIKRSLPVTHISQYSDFVRLGVNWRAHNGDQRCDENASLANSITISPKTKLNYRVDSSKFSTVDDFWNALPADVSILVASKKLDLTSFDSTWRIGTSILRSGKNITIKSIPEIGDEVDVKGLSIPSVFAEHPAFADFKFGASVHKITNISQIGVLILLGGESISGDIVVSDIALQKKIVAALDALQVQLAKDADAVDALRLWRDKNLPLAKDVTPSKGIGVMPMGKKRVLTVASDAGAQFAGLQETGLQKLLVNSAVTVATAQPAQWDESKGIRLTSLGGTEDSFDVVSKGDWSVNFPLSAVASHGKIPAELTLYMAAAPGASKTKPVASVFWNGVLLSAKQLNATGEAEKLQARIPSYALGVSNNLRVSIQRQPYSTDCNELPQAYPASVFPAISYVAPGNVHPDGTFVGVLPLLGMQSQLLIPEAYLTDAPASLERIAGISAASGISASQAELIVIKPKSSAKPTKPFLSMDVALMDVKPQVLVNNGKQLKIRGKEVSWLDISGLSEISSAEVVKSGSYNGISWYSIGEFNSKLNTSFLLNRGNIAVIGNNGPVAWVDSSNPDEGIFPNIRKTPFYEWRNFVSWGVPGIVMAVLILLLIVWMAWRIAHKSKK